MDDGRLQQRALGDAAERGPLPQIQSFAQNPGGGAEVVLVIRGAPLSGQQFETGQIQFVRENPEEVTG